MQRTGLKKKTAVCILLSLVLAFGVGLLTLPAVKTNAATIRTSALYSSSDSVKYKGTSDGTELTLTNGSSGSVTFKNTLYMDGAEIALQIQSDNFDMLTVSFLSTNTDETKADKLENKVELSRAGGVAGGKLQVRFVDGDLTDAEQREITAQTTETDFLNAEVTIKYDAATKRFSVKAGSETAEYGMKDKGGAEAALTNGIYYNEATMKIAFSEIDQKENSDDDDIVVKTLISKINGQSMAEVSSTLTDTQQPQIAIDFGKYNIIDTTKTDDNIVKIREGEISLPSSEWEMAETQPFYAAANANMDVPIRVYDVLQTSLDVDLDITLIKDSNGNSISTEEQNTETVKGRTNCYLGKEGLYKIVAKVEISTDSDSEDVERTIYVKTVKDEKAPKIPADYDYALTTQFAAAGSSFQVKRPEIGDDLGVDTKFNVSYTIWYMSPSSSEWTKATGLSFTPSSQGLYRIKVQAEDAAGNRGSQSEGEYQINFRDSDPPKITISNFPKTAYIDEAVTIPTGSASDTVDSSPTKSYVVYYVADDGTETEIEVSNNTFTPDKLGIYKVVYTVTDAAGFKTVEERSFTVIEDDREDIKSSSDFWNGWTISLLCIAGAALIGIVALIFVKPKDKKKDKKA